MVSALLDTQKSLATHYGAVVCLHRLGLHVVDAILLDNVKIYTYLIPILSPDSAQKSKQIWCSSDPYKAYMDWMINGVAPSGKGECSTPLDKNMAFAKTYGVTGTPTLFFTDGSRFPGAVQITDIEKKFTSLK